MADRSIVTRLRAEIGQYKTAMEEAAKSTRVLVDAQDKSTSKSKENGKASEEAARKSKESAQQQREAWDMVGKSLVAVGTGVVALGAAMLKTGIEYNTLQQTTRAALTSLLGSSKAAADQMDRLDEFARNSPFSKATFIQAQQQMLAFGIETRKVVPYLDAIQNAVAAAGGSNDDIAAIVATMSKIQSSAKLTAEDLNEFGNRGVNAAELIGSQMGMTGAEIREAITSGSLDATKALDALAAGMSQRFDGAADNVKNTFAGAMDRVMAAWRDLSSALAEPFVGKDGGGVFTALLNETADLMRGFESLPGPIKATVAAIGLVGGAAALLGGSLILLTPRIAETKASLEVLRATSPAVAGAIDKSTKAFGFLGKAMIAATAAYAAWNLAAREGSTDAVTLGANEMTSAILDAEKGMSRLNAAFSLDGHRSWLALGQEVASGVDGIADAFSKLDRGAVRGFVDHLTPWKDGFDQAAEGVEQLDKQLAQLVQTGNEAGAADFMRRLSAETGKSVSELTRYLPQYKDALVGVQNEQSATASSSDDLTAAIKEQEEAWKRNATAAMGQRGAQIAAQQSLADANALIAEGTRILRDQTGAIDINAASTMAADTALIDMAQSYMSVYDAMVENNAAASDLDATLASQRDSFINTATQMGYTKAEAEALADSYGLIPRTVTTTANLTKAAGWDSVYGQITSQLDRITGQRTFTSLLNFAVGKRPNLLTDTFAEGGHVSGPGTATSDSIPALLSNGEHVLTARDVQAMGGQAAVYKMRQMLHRYADGGAVQYRAAARGYAGGGAVHRVTATVGDVTARTDRADTEYLANRIGQVVLAGIRGGIDANNYRQSRDGMYGGA